MQRACRSSSSHGATLQLQGRPWLLSLSAFPSAPAAAPQRRHPVKLCKPQSAAPLCSDAELPVPLLQGRAPNLPAPFFPLALAPCRRAARPLPPCAAALPTPPWSAQGPSDPSSSSELTVAHGAPTPCYTFSRPPLPSSNISFPQTALAMAGALRSASAQLPLPQPHNVGASRVFDEMLG